MRLWIFHPVIFYPLALLVAALVIGISLRPQALPRTPAAVTGHVANGALVIDGAGFDAPAPDAAQYLTVKRDFWGAAYALRIAQMPNSAAPVPADHGVRILLASSNAALITGRRVTVDVTYLPSAVNASSALAVSLQGSGQTSWVTRPTPPQPGTLRFELPPQANADAIGLRAISPDNNEAYGLEITRIRLTPHA